eukprot:4331785-Pyramimonas_sp.AAC.1
MPTARPVLEWSPRPRAGSPRSSGESARWGGVRVGRVPLQEESSDIGKHKIARGRCLEQSFCP